MAVGFSFVALIFLGLIGIVACVVSWRGVAALIGLFKGMQTGHATLNCPHCGKETVPTNGRCTSCGSEL